jgi:molecular chaperone DnaJ
MEKRDYYEVLGLTKGASKTDIKTAYRKLAKEFHPDRNKAADAEKKFREVQESYEVLSDERKKAAYDQYGHAGAQGFGGGGFDTSGFNGFGGFDMNGDLGDIFEQFFGGNFGGFGGSSKPRKSRGEDLEFNLKISFKEGIFGTDKTIRYKRRVVCNSCNGNGAKDSDSIKACTKCNGTGQIRKIQNTIMGNFQTVVNCPECNGHGTIIKNPCTVCAGHGVINITDDFSIKVPQGIPDGVTLRFKEKGNAGLKGGAYGDLYINIEIEEDDYFEKKNDDIYTDLIIDVSDAVLGGTKNIQTVHGADTMTIPAGTQPETIIKLSGKGAPRFKNTGNGDHYVKIIVQIPKKLNKEQKVLWEELDKIKDQKSGFSRFF